MDNSFDFHECCFLNGLFFSSQLIFLYTLEKSPILSLSSFPGDTGKNVPSACGTTEQDCDRSREMPWGERFSSSYETFVMQPTPFLQTGCTNFE